MGLFSRKKKTARRAPARKQPEQWQEQPQPDAYPPGQEDQYQRRAYAERPPENVKVVPKVEYGETGVTYVIQISNLSANVLGDSRAELYLPKELATVNPMVENVGLIQSGETKTVNFILPVPDKPGKYPLECLVSYFDFAQKIRIEGTAPKKLMHVWSPKLSPAEIGDFEWRINISHMVGKEIESDEIPMSAQDLFDKGVAILKAMNLFLLPPNVVPSLFRGIQQAYGRDSRRTEYACQYQVIGDEFGSKMLIQLYAQRAVAMVGFYAKLIVAFDKKMQIKKFLV